MAEKKSFKDAIVEGAARIGADASELEKAVRAELTARVAKTIAEQVAEGDIEPPQPNQPGPSGLMY
jgi:hypothetical protein